MTGLARWFLTVGLLFFATGVWAADDPLSISAITLTTDAQGQQEYSVSLQILLIMTALGFIPAFVMLMTCFTRIIIVFSILRQALGLQQTPSNQILIGLTIFLTLFIMAPVFEGNALSETKGQDVKVVRSHTSSMSALKNILEENAKQEEMVCPMK